MPLLTWLCDVCKKQHPTCDLAAKCERSHPPGSTYCEPCKGGGWDMYCLDKCGHCDGAGTVLEKEQEQE